MRWVDRLPKAGGGIAAQAAQSGAAFVIQVLASRALGADGFATFALLYGAIIMATALTSGLVGDSLTVLNRHDPSIRAGLRTCAVVLVVLAAWTAFAVGLAMDSVSALAAASRTAVCTATEQ